MAASIANFHLIVESAVKKKEREREKKVMKKQDAEQSPIASRGVPTRARVPNAIARRRKFPSRLDYPRSPQGRKMEI